MEDLDPAAVPDRDHTTVHTSCEVDVGLDVEHQSPVVAGHNVEDVDALDTEEFISPRTP